MRGSYSTSEAVEELARRTGRRITYDTMRYYHREHYCGVKDVGRLWWSEGDLDYIEARMRRGPGRPRARV